MGSTTLRKQGKRAGAEPGESYCIGSDKTIPDLAIEVIVTSGSIDRLELYRRLGVQEVWFWQCDRMTLHALREKTPVQFVDTAGYEQIFQSSLLPGLDIDLLTRCIQNPQPLVAAKAFRQGVISSLTGS
ncbi:MAG: Uma2 family endonuclease [Cyanobacteria bacterium P01_A01_bin.114]